MQAFVRRVDFSGKTVLEVGGALPADFVINHVMAARWVAVNFYGWGEGQVVPDGCLPLAEATAPLLDRVEHQVFDGRAEDIPECFAGRFDLICSINAFEHIRNIWKTLEKLHLALKPGGLLVATFSPLWPGSIGHHVWIDQDYNFNTFSGLPDYIHLRYSKRRVRDIVSARYGSEIADRFVQRAFFDPVINRLFVEDYVDALETSAFPHWELSPWGVESDRRLLKELRACAGKRVFALGLELLAQKPVG